MKEGTLHVRIPCLEDDIIHFQVAIQEVIRQRQPHQVTSYIFSQTDEQIRATNLKEMELPL